MKLKLATSFAASVFALASLAQGAITVSIKNFTSVSAGNPIVSALGVPAATNTIFASAGIFTTEPNWATATASSIIAAFTALDGTPVSNTGFTGVFTGNDTTTLAAYATGFENATPYILVGNSSTLANSTLVAVYKSVGQVYTPAVAGIANVPVNGTTYANWVFGNKVTVTSPSGSSVANNTFTQGISLAASAVPEPSAALLGAIGALGLLRRRRN